MEDWAISLVTGVIAGLIGAWSTYALSLKQDRVQRKRERIVAHLIEAYRNLEDAAGREPLDRDRKQKVESSIASIFLLGSAPAADEAKKLAIDIASEKGNMKKLLSILRNDLRLELGLENHNVELQFLRFRDETKLD